RADDRAASRQADRMRRPEIPSRQACRAQTHVDRTRGPSVGDRPAAPRRTRTTREAARGPPVTPGDKRLSDRRDRTLPQQRLSRSSGLQRRAIRAALVREEALSLLLARPHDLPWLPCWRQVSFRARVAARPRAGLPGA